MSKSLSMPRRSVALLAAMLLAMSMMAGTATAKERGRPADLHCPGHQSEAKVDVPSGWDFYEDGPYVEVVSVYDTRTEEYVDVTVTIDGKTVEFSSDDYELEDVEFCIKGGPNNTGALSGLSGDTYGIPNRGGNAPDVSYVVVYSVTTEDDVPVFECDDSTSSGGAGVTTTVHELGQPSGTFDFNYIAYSVPDRFQVYYEGALLLDEVIGTSANAAAYASLYQPGGIFHDTDTIDAVSQKTTSLSYSGTSTQVTVVVSGPGGTVWDYTVFCPAPDDNDD
jgi:hypothetical protein